MAQWLLVSRQSTAQGDAMNENELLARMVGVCTDAEKRYQRAARDVERAELEEFFNRQATIRKDAADELQLLRSSNSTDGEESGTLSGFVDRHAMDVSVAMSKGDTGVVDWCRQDDESAIREYDEALRQSPSPSLKKILERQRDEVRAAITHLDDVLRVFGGPRS
jgi:uncharacterized protein (TIGR02284 family)